MEEKKRHELTDEQRDKVAGGSVDSCRCNDYCPNCGRWLDFVVPAQGAWVEPCPNYCGVALCFVDGKIKYYIDKKGKRQPINQD